MRAGRHERDNCNVSVHALGRVVVVVLSGPRTRRRRVDCHRRLRDCVCAEARERKRVRAHWPPREHPRAAVGLRTLRRRALGVDGRRRSSPARHTNRPRGRREGAGAGEPARCARLPYS